jgi:ubiquinone/menaquinone biosynthesis C-methylase UbiE
MSDKKKPDWAGDDLLSQFVNLLIQTKPIYAVMKYQARQVLIKTAERNGIAWRKNCEELAASGVQGQLDQITNAAIAYPDYYQAPFHAYDQGNLCWQAAFEAEPATYAMALRVWPKESLTWQEAQDRLRDSFHQVLATHGPQKVRDILDMGCSIGISTLALHRFYQNRANQNHSHQTFSDQHLFDEANPQIAVHTVGLDLSPYMLAVARQRDVHREIEWIHGKAEQTHFPDASFDLVTLQFVTHELPGEASQAIFQEVWRLLRPGGCLAIVDNNPESPVIQNLPPVLFTLMKSTEPWSDEYYTFDIQGAMQAVGFEKLMTVASDPRHRTILGQKP